MEKLVRALARAVKNVESARLPAPASAIAVVAFMLMAALDARKIHGAILIGIFVRLCRRLLLGLGPFTGIASLPPSIAPVFLKMDLAALFDTAMLAVVLTFFFIVVFDNTGTLIGVARAAGMMQPDGSLPRLERALAVDSTAAMAGAALGTSTTTSYIESAAGVNAGGRTGLVAVTVAVLFLATLFFAPLAGSIPAFATAPALIFVGCLMMAAAKDIDFDDPTEYVPAAVTIIAMPLTYRRRHRLRLHRLRRHQAAGRPLGGAAGRRLCAGGLVYSALCAAVRLGTAKPMDVCYK